MPIPFQQTVFFHRGFNALFCLFGLSLDPVTLRKDDVLVECQQHWKEVRKHSCPAALCG